MRRSAFRTGSAIATVVLAATVQQAGCFSGDNATAPPASDMDASGSHDGTVADSIVGAVEAGYRDVGVDVVTLDAAADVAVDAAPADAPADTSSDVETDASLDAPTDAPADAPALDAAVCAVTTGLVGYWPFEEGSGTTTADLSGNGNAGTLTDSPTWTTSVPPTSYPNTYALSFDGVQSYVTMGNPDALRITGALTLAGWFEATASLPSYRMLMSKWWTGGSDAAYAIYWQTGLGPNFELNTGGGALLSTSASLPYNDGAWHFVAATWDGSTSSLYVDAVLVAAVTPDAAFGPLQDVTHPFDVATDDRYPPGSGDRFFPGLIDEVRVYDRALSAAEVGALFDGTCAAH